MLLRITSLILLLSFSIYGESADSLKSYDLNEVVITASRNKKLLKKTPEVLHVISSKDIEELNVSSTGEILEFLTGVSIETGTGSGFPKRSIISLDGFPANYSLVMVDGIRLVTEHIHTGQNVDVVPPENIERIEVIKGASSAQYGSDAMGGIINIITKKSIKKTQSSISFSKSNYDTYNAVLSFRSPINEKVNISSCLNYEESAGIPILAPKHRLGNMGYTKLTTMNNLGFNLSDVSSLFMNIIYSQNSMEFREDNLYSKMLLTSVNYEYKIKKDLVANANLKYSSWDAELSGEENRILNPEVYLSYITNNNLITIGADFKRVNFTRSAVQKKSQDIIGVYAQDEVELSKLSFLVALRLDKVENISPVLTPKFAVMYKVLDNLRLRASLGRGFHAPTVQELFEEGYGHGGNAYRFGNSDLLPEYSLTTTFSIEYSPVKSLDLLVHGYYNSITDMITPIFGGVWEENPDTSAVIYKWVRTNIHEAKIYGFESTIRFNLDEKLILEGGYTYTHNENVTTGEQLPYYPGESISAKLIYKYDLISNLPSSCFVSLRIANNRSAWNWKPVKGTEVNNENGLVTDLENYELLNAGIQVMFVKDLNIYLNVRNILGQDIQKLDDAFTEIKGEPTVKVGFLKNF